MPEQEHWRSLDQHEYMHVFLGRLTAWGVLLQMLRVPVQLGLMGARSVSDTIDLCRFAHEAAATYTQAEAILSEYGEEARLRFVESLLKSPGLVCEYFEPFLCMSLAVQAVEDASLMARVPPHRAHKAFLACLLAQVALNAPVFDALGNASSAVQPPCDALRSCESGLRMRLVQQQACGVVKAMFPRPLTDEEYAVLRDNPAAVPDIHAGDSDYSRLSKIMPLDRASYNYDPQVSNDQVRRSRAEVVASYLNQPALVEILLRCFNPDTSEYEAAVRWAVQSQRQPEHAISTCLSFPEWPDHGNAPRLKSLATVSFAPLEGLVVHTYVSPVPRGSQAPYALVHVAEKGYGQVFRVEGDDVAACISRLAGPDEHWFVADWEAFDFEQRLLRGMEAVVPRVFLVCAVRDARTLGCLRDTLVGTTYRKALVLSESSNASFPVGIVKAVDSEAFVLLIMLTRSQLQSFVSGIEADAQNWLVDGTGEHKMSRVVIEQLNCVVAHFYANGF